MLKPGQRAIFCDDLLATGGTAAAAIHLARQIGVEVVHAAFIIELTFLQGRNKLRRAGTSLVSLALSYGQNSEEPTVWHFAGPAVAIVSA